MGFHKYKIMDEFGLKITSDLMKFRHPRAIGFITVKCCGHGRREWRFGMQRVVLLCFKRVDDLGAYRIPSEIRLLIPSVFGTTFE